MDFAIYIISAIAIMVVLLVGQQLLLFDSGILSLGTPAFFVCGAYTSAILAKHAGCPVMVSILLASITGPVLALLVGCPWLRRLRSDFFAVATLALAQATVVVLRAAAPGGLSGMAGVPPFATQWVLSIPPVTAGMALTVTAAAASLTGIHWLRQRRIGAIIVAVRVDENAAAALGIRPVLVKLQAFLLSSFLAALAGGMQAHLLGVVEPRMASISMTVVLLVGTILSGRKAWGCVFGATFVVLMPELLQRLFLLRSEPHWRVFLASQAIYGAIIIALVFSLPWLQQPGASRSGHA